MVVQTIERNSLHQVIACVTSQEQHMYPNPNVSKIRFNLAEIHSHYNVNILNVFCLLQSQGTDCTIMSCQMFYIKAQDTAIEREPWTGWTLMLSPSYGRALLWGHRGGEGRGLMVQMYSMLKKGNEQMNCFAISFKINVISKNKIYFPLYIFFIRGCGYLCDVHSKSDVCHLSWLPKAKWEG